jgi:hypothetical protein
LSRGRSRNARDGQLALLDAMMFFAIAMLVTDVCFSYFGQTSASGLDRPGIERCDPGTILGVFLEASLGRSIAIPSSPEAELDGKDQVSDCLLVEMECVESCGDPLVFASLNQLFLEILLEICPPGMSPLLVSYSAARFIDEPVLVVSDPGWASYERADVRAASATMSSSEQHAYLVVLKLAPATLPELIDI